MTRQERAKTATDAKARRERRLGREELDRQAFAELICDFLALAHGRGLDAMAIHGTGYQLFLASIADQHVEPKS